VTDMLLNVKKLCLSYDGKKILSDVSFCVKKGDFLVIFGENGSGKSSLIKAVLGLKQAKSGSIEYCGINKHEIGYLPQASAVQHDFPASVYEVVLSGCLNKTGLRPFYTKKEKQLADENMKLLNIYDKKNEPFGNLSGGQKQRTLLARALCSAGKMILLDEPVTGLDPAAAADFYEMIDKINKSGIAVIMVSHDVHAALSIASHVLNIGNHGTLFYGTPGDYEAGTVIEGGK